MREKYVYFQSNAAASLAVTGELTVTAVDKSSKGNLISVAIADGGAEGAATVSVSGNAITVTQGTGNNVDAVNIAAAINAHADASALVTATSSGSTDLTGPVTQAFLSGGESGVSFPLSSFAGMGPTDADDLVLYFKSIRNFDGTTSTADAEVISDKVKLKLIDDNSIREAMDDICKAFTSARTRPFDIVIGDERADGVQKISSLISKVEVIDVKSAN